MRKIRHARVETHLRTLPKAIATQFDGSNDMHIRVHVLQRLCRKRFAKRLPQLRWRVCAKTDKTESQFEE